MDKDFPKFRYHPDPIGTGAFKKADKPQICECCGKKTGYVYESPFYSTEDVECLCPWCIADGSAAKTNLYTVPRDTSGGSRKSGWHIVMITALLWAMWVWQNLKRWVFQINWKISTARTRLCSISVISENV